MADTPETTQPWSWPEGAYIVLFHWSWAQGGPENLIHGWSLAAETDDAGYIHLEAERNEEPFTARVDKAGYPSTRRHTFRSITELPSELMDADKGGQPLPWVRALVEACAARQA